jgi:hypothetical protein
MISCQVDRVFQRDELVHLYTLDADLDDMMMANEETYDPDWVPSTSSTEKQTSNSDFGPDNKENKRPTTSLDNKTASSKQTGSTRTRVEAPYDYFVFTSCKDLSVIQSF